MNISRNIFTYFFILVYGVSFGHQIIPHHHHEESLEEIHDHCAADLETHDHISHEEHFDEGLIDYLACLLGNHIHSPANDCQFITSSEKNKRTLKSSCNLKIAVCELFISIENQSLQSVSFPHEIAGLYQDPISQKRALRGPPFNMA